MIEVSRITFAYPKGLPIFENFSWQVSRGKSWSIIGFSGCGKTTLLYLLAGLHRPSSGHIAINGKHITRPRPKTGLVLQDHGLLPWATVWENAYLGFKIRKFYGADGKHVPDNDTYEPVQARQRTTYWLKRMNIAHLENKYPAQLSGGQRQRAAICRSLALQPDLLLLDEPFSSLDAPAREDLERLMIRLNQETSLTMVIVTHNIEEAVLLGQNILVLQAAPNKHPLVCKNSFCFSKDYWKKPEFQSQCQQVREMLGDRA